MSYIVEWFILLYHMAIGVIPLHKQKINEKLLSNIMNTNQHYSKWSKVSLELEDRVMMKTKYKGLMCSQ